MVSVGDWIDYNGLIYFSNGYKLTSSMEGIKYPLKEVFHFSVLGLK